MKLRLATRGSQLAWGQSSQIAEQLRALGHQVELVKVTTHGDVSTAPLTSMGGIGVFVGAVRQAVLDGRADFAVHSFKDLPTAPEEGLTLAAVPIREDPRDALCSPHRYRLADLSAGANVGTGSPRRAAQLRALRPDLNVVEIRGNVETRLARAGADLDAVILAAAGLSRLGLTDNIGERFDPTTFLPAPAQGALALECRSDDAPTRAALAQIDDQSTRLAAQAERAVLAGLQAGCAAPVAARAEVTDHRLTLHAVVVAEDGSKRLHSTAQAAATLDGADAAGADVVADLLTQGAAELVNLGASKAKPLVGQRLLVPQRSPGNLTQALIAAGAAVTEAEFTRQEPLPLAPLHTAMTTGFDWVVVSSAATINALLSQGFDLATLHRPGVKLAAIGPATAKVMADAGLEPDFVARPAGGAALVEAFGTGPGTILMPGAEKPSPQPADGLAENGWTVQPVAVYRTVPGTISAEVSQQWPDFDAFIVTAASVARAGAALGIPGAPVIAIGNPSAEAAKAAGLTVLAVARNSDANSLLDATLSVLS